MDKSVSGGKISKFLGEEERSGIFTHWCDCLSDKGKGKQRHVWDFEMNEMREIYLKIDSVVDKIDKILKDWVVFYQTWRWWYTLISQLQGNDIMNAFKCVQKLCRDFCRSWMEA